MQLLDPENHDVYPKRHSIAGSTKTAREIRKDFAEKTAKIAFTSNIYTLLPVDYLPTDGEDDDDSDAEKERMIPTKPKRKSKKDKAAAKEKVPRRKRNEDKKRDDLLRSHFNQATINVGPVSSHLNPLLLQSGFRDIFDRTLLHWQYHSNRIRIAVNLFLRRTPFDGTLLSINDIARTVDSDSSVTTLHDLICLISPAIKYPSHEKLEAKRFPVAVYQQTIVELVGNLKSLLINNFMRVLIIRTQRLLDNAFNRPVAAGISKLLSAFLMGRRGTIVQSKDEVGLEDDPINDDNDGLDDDSLDRSQFSESCCGAAGSRKKPVPPIRKFWITFLISSMGDQT